MNKKTKAVKILSYVFGILLVISVFKNISYPLMWADESMTAMGSERVVEYGYPKAHDGKNVVNDMFCSTPRVGVNAKDDAFIGGANWGQYYIGAIGYKLANGSEDIYTKTGIFRSVFAAVGLLGLFLLAYNMSGFFEDEFQKFLFVSLFLLAELISVSMALHLREVRYYSPALFFSSALIALYVRHRFYKPINNILYCVLLAVLLWVIFNMFSPLYFIFISAIGISEIFYILQNLKTHGWKEAIRPSVPAIAAIGMSYAGVYPLLGYFKTFEMKAILDSFYHFNSDMYWWHFSNEVRYFGKLELLWLAVAMRSLVFANYKTVFKEKPKNFRASNYLSLLFVVFLFSVPNIDSPMFTRYLIYMQPVLVIIALFDFIYLLKIYKSGASKLANGATILGILFIGLFGLPVINNLPFISGHLYEMTHQYKGPLDYTIPYIKANYPKPEDLSIATNYEETSYMYYLKSKVIVGFVGNNLPEDTVFQPDIISYRQSLGSNFAGVFNLYLKRANYTRTSFPGKDIPVNNIPELNFDMPQYNHYFKSAETDDEQKQVGLLIKMR